MTMLSATKARIAELKAPDKALVALAETLAAMLDDPDQRTAACAKEFRSTMASLSVQDNESGRSAANALKNALDGV